MGRKIFVLFIFLFFFCDHRQQCESCLSIYISKVLVHSAEVVRSWIMRLQACTRILMSLSNQKTNKTTDSVFCIARFAIFTSFASFARIVSIVSIASIASIAISSQMVRATNLKQARKIGNSDNLKDVFDSVCVCVCVEYYS